MAAASHISQLQKRLLVLEDCIVKLSVFQSQILPLHRHSLDKAREQQGLLQQCLQNFKGVQNSTVACVQQEVQSQDKYLETAVDSLPILTKRALLVKRHIVLPLVRERRRLLRCLDVVPGRLCP